MWIWIDPFTTLNTVYVVLARDPIRTPFIFMIDQLAK